MPYALSTTLNLPYELAVVQTRAALADQGFGVLTEIDVAATLKAKLDVDVPPQVILGACRPPLAYQALQAEPSVGVLLPCNVVVRSTGDRETIVEAMDPEVMVTVADSEAIREVAGEARRRISAALESLHVPHSSPGKHD
ncbi:MAG TPA: DUF302 domain-containing protein [Segeticoccus sp.]|uniref:DUF302 domain-containing protein n=1 Tax=Segeticoccus sp. TaxID=2706531 RepID=UPI002D7E3860|nr:DUF302 domain-containing protein [Segeticoccus sp.]HET8600552.1 DUF302 domain-containing protein [Segeticoccus sp.]